MKNLKSDSPEQSDASLGGGGHAAVVIDGVLGRDVVLQEQTFWIFLLQCVPLPRILELKKGSNKIRNNSFFSTCLLCFDCTHSDGVEVLLDCEAVDGAGGGQAALDAGQQDQQQGQLGGGHSGRRSSGPQTGNMLKLS